MSKYTFKGSKPISSEYSTDPKPAVHKYYQVCYFPHPKTHKYNVRKFIINEKGDFISVAERQYTDIQYQNFLKMHKPHEYKMYGTYDINTISYPRSGDIMLAQSPILDIDNGYYGPAKF